MTEPIQNEKLDFLSQEIEAVSQAIDQELQKDERNYFKLEESIRKLMFLWYRKFSKDDRKTSQDFEVEIENRTQSVKDTYNTWCSLGTTVAAAGLSAAGGASGLFSLVSSQAIFNAAGQSLPIIGQGAGNVSSLFNNRNEGERTVRQLYLKESERRMDSRKQDVSQERSHLQQALREITDSYAREHQIAQQILGAYGN